MRDRTMRPVVWDPESYEAKNNIPDLTDPAFLEFESPESRARRGQPLGAVAKGRFGSAAVHRHVVRPVLDALSEKVEAMNRSHMTAADKEKYGRWVPALESESCTHLPGHNFTGPGTDVATRLSMGVRPTNAVDAAALQHDLAYQGIHDGVKSHKIPRADIPILVRQADMFLLENVAHLHGHEKPADHSDRVVRHAMEVKIAAEDSGIISPEKFVTASGRFRSGMDNFNYRFRKLEAVRMPGEEGRGEKEEGKRHKKKGSGSR
jgi:hypothetical protein